MKKSYIYATLAVVVLTALLVITGVLVGSRLIGGSGSSGETTQAVNNTVVRPVAGGSDDSIAIPGFEKLVMKAGQAKQSVNFYNPEKNACYFRISFALADGTELFRSGMIKPGQTIDTIEISRLLEVGTYEKSVLQYDCYTLEGLQSLNGSKTILDLEVIP
ncbi:MAG: tRNA (uracil-5-)-methyltransferase [Thermincola sp.]|jgi:hypothetical protein|nr:tRNA (uracil-5-)-methyltransferase [Thermincola sp.]MDT3702671.1 tRNA (uracil-5-)-methyltransferase [Thermincola sp.]